MSSADANADVSTTSGVLDCVSIGGAVADESVGAGASLVGSFTFSNLLNLFELICSNNAAMSSGLATAEISLEVQDTFSAASVVVLISTIESMLPK